jgi:hypothetical protein
MNSGTEIDLASGEIGLRPRIRYGTRHSKF